MLLLDTRNILDTSVGETIKKIEEMGEAQYEAFVTERLDKRTTSLYEPIKRNKLSLFSSAPPCKEKSKDKMQIASLKSNCSLCAPVCFLSSSRWRFGRVLLPRKSEFSSSSILLMLQSAALRR